MRKLTLRGCTLLLASVAFVGTAYADNSYGPYPVTLKSYSGDKKNSVSYSGQIARHVLEKSLKKLAGKGDGGGNAAEVEAQLLKYYNGKDGDLPIVDPKSKDGFPIKQKTMGEISGGANLEGKFYNGAMPAWPGNKTGKEVILHMFKHAAKSKGGFDAETGFDWGQLISKYTMGAVPFNQAVDNYLDEKMQADNKPNGKPYKDGAHYTGKEHSWDEAFGYFGAAAHSLSLSANDNYGVSKLKDLGLADANGDGVVDLKTEMVFGPAYYAADADKSGTKYMEAIVGSFIEGRKVITSAKGENLSADQLAAVQKHAANITSNWEKVLAEATFKYAGSVYKDIAKLGAEKDEAKKAKIYRDYAKHWGELKGFSMALQAGKTNLGETAVEMNKLIGFSPVTMNNKIVTGLDGDGNFVMDRRKAWSDYQLHMLKLQKMLATKFGLKALKNDATGDLAALAEKLDTDLNAETD
ncbi:MAG: DUF4856 domain-containing protein [Pseudomonadota bacterium]